MRDRIRWAFDEGRVQAADAMGDWLMRSIEHYLEH